ncbi:MAG: hypothetical protein QM820_20960 [Minicystis sp.]
MHHDDEHLRAELERIEHELDRELLLHETCRRPEQHRTSDRARPRDLRRHVERGLLAGVSLMALALGVRAFGHRCPEPPPAVLAQPIAVDAGTLADDPPQAAGDPRDQVADGEPQDDVQDDCPAVTPKQDPEWVHARLMLAEAPEPEDALPAPWSTPIAWDLAVPSRLAGFFPAASRDGRTVVQVYNDTKDFSGDAISTMVFFSVASGKAFARFTLHEGRETEEAKRDPRAAEVLLRGRERDLAAANRILDATTWRHLASARTPSRPCPGTPWEKLDEARSQREDWSWKRVARFDDDGIDLEYEPERREITIRALQEDGTVSTNVVDARLEAPGSWGGWGQDADVGKGCGENRGIDGFGDRALGIYFLVGTDTMLGGDACGGVDEALRASALRLPRSRSAARRR